MKHSFRIALISSLLLQAFSLGANAKSISFFASNNSGTIDIQTAYQRLQGQPQHDLQNNLITILQKYHVEQGRMSEVLGAYHMENHDDMTADNTESFISSPNQDISDHLAFRLARKIAKTLNQESVAVLIPGKKQVIAELELSFVAEQPTISEATKILHDKLPANYSQAYSLHITNTNADFNHAKVRSVEWLGGQTNYDEIKKAFPGDNVSYQYGRAYLVFQNGQTQQL